MPKLSWELRRKYYKRYIEPAVPFLLIFMLGVYVLGTIDSDYAVKPIVVVLPAAGYLLFEGIYVEYLMYQDLKESPNQCWYKET